MIILEDFPLNNEEDYFVQLSQNSTTESRQFIYLTRKQVEDLHALLETII